MPWLLPCQLRRSGQLFCSASGLVWSPGPVLQDGRGGFCFSAQALDIILEKMKASGFDFSHVLALSGAGQVSLQQPRQPRVSRVPVLEAPCAHWGVSQEPGAAWPWRMCGLGPCRSI